MSKLDELQRVEVTSSVDWRQWLQNNHQQKVGVWLIRYKKPDPRHVSWSDAVDEALCFGWIDSLPRKLDDQRSMLLVTPRKPKSAWSGINKEKVERLTAVGRMTDAGLKVVANAKASGTWHKLVAVERLEMPLDLVDAFVASKTAKKNFDAFPPSAKRGILDWISQAKRPETRAARIAETVEKAKNNIRANHWRQPISGK
jgi:uncharacterized protein YdeI (YjbR/CyaY-like superfamily)